MTKAIFLLIIALTFSASFVAMGLYVKSIPEHEWFMMTTKPIELPYDFRKGQKLWIVVFTDSGGWEAMQMNQPEGMVVTKTEPQPDQIRVNRFWIFN